MLCERLRWRRLHSGGGVGTAKARKGGHEKCIDAGASDYRAKPVDTAGLLTMLRLWLTE